MKIQTNNKLAHLQVELQETVEQNRCLEVHLQNKKAEVANLENYIRVNSGDKRVMAQYKKACRDITTLYNQVRRNSQKITRLQMSIQKEGMRINGYTQRRYTNSWR